MAAAAAPFRVVLHPSAPSGIKSIATLADGQVFLATSAGLVRFERVRHVPVLPLPASLNMMMASSDGRHLWVSSQTGLLRFDPVKHAARQVLQQPMWGLAEVAGRVFARTSEKEAYAVDPTLQEPPRLFACARAEFVHTGLSTHGWASSPNASYRLDPASLAQHPVAGLPPEYRFAFPDGSGRVWTLHADGARAWQDGRQVAFVSARPQQSNPFTAGRNGQVWFATDRTVLGLNPPVELPLQYELKPNGRVAVHEDARGHIWVGTDTGQLWEVIPDAAWEQWTLADLAAGATPVQLFRDALGQLILVTEKTLYHLDETARRWQALAPEPHHYQFVLPLSDRGLLASTDDAGLLRLDAAGKRVGPAAPNSAAPFLLRGFRALARLPGPVGAVAVGNRNALLHWDPRANVLQLVPTPGVENPGRVLPDVPTYPNAVDFASDRQGRLWMGYTPGLAVWDPAASAWQRLSTQPPVEKVRSFTFGRDDTEIWVAHRDTGYFSRVHNGRVTRLAAADGYEPGKTFFLKRDRRGWIWRGTPEAVYVSDGRATGPFDWIRLSASGESRIYGFFEDRDGSIWIAGVEGVTHLRPDPAWFRRRDTPPAAPRVLTDGREWRDGAVPVSRLLRFEVPANDLGHFTGAVQHRLLPRHADWRSAPQAHFEYADVAPGRYRLEVQQAGYNGTFARNFVVGQAAAGTVRWPIWMLAGSLGCLAGWLVMRREHVGYQIGKARMLLRHWWQQDRRGERDPADLTGRVLKQRYCLVRPLSTGGFSQVYEAEDLEAGAARVAVKLLFRRAGEGPWARDQFAKEVTAMQWPRIPASSRSWTRGSTRPVNRAWRCRCWKVPRCASASCRASVGSRSARRGSSRSWLTRSMHSTGPASFIAT